MEDREKRAMPRLLSMNVGLPRDVACEGRRYMNRATPNCNAVPCVDRCNAERQVDEFRL